ncbi:protein phosphatase 2C domain-containing protein [Frankia sp. CiP1_Cm_nod2]|uniref:protein phosphatase 2C domain-containing protein n=1 Tax=Frankia sp. CiP1_Cm_nod2 TaxID=2897161 RepID=UPI004043C295
MANTAQERIDRTLAALSEAAASQAAALIALENAPERALLVPDRLTGGTRRRATTALNTLADAWHWYGILNDLVGRARALRGDRARLDARTIDELDALLHGPMPRRGVRPAELASRTDAALRTVRTCVDEITAAWNTHLAAVGAAEQRIAAAAATAARLRLDDDAGLAIARRLLAEFAEQAATDPLSLPESLSARLAAAVAAAGAGLDELARRHDTLPQALREAHQLLAGIVALIERAAADADRAHGRVLPPGRSLTRLPDGVLDDERHGLRTWLERLAAAASAGRWKEASRGLDRWRELAEATAISARRVAEANAAMLRTRDDLRGLLAGWQAKAAGRGVAEEPELTSLYRQARSVLYTAPTDLDRAAALVHAFGAAVDRRGAPHPGPAPGPHPGPAPEPGPGPGAGPEPRAGPGPGAGPGPEPGLGAEPGVEPGADAAPRSRPGGHPGRPRHATGRAARAQPGRILAAVPPRHPGRYCRHAGPAPTAWPRYVTRAAAAGRVRPWTLVRPGDTHVIGCGQATAEATKTGRAGHGPAAEKGRYGIDQNGGRCPACAAPVRPGDRFCEACGTPLRAIPPGGTGDTDHREIDLGPIAGVCDRGVRHTTNEDAMGVLVVGSTLIAVVCDGVSSTPGSGPAARSAARVAAATAAAVLARPVTRSHPGRERDDVEHRPSHDRGRPAGPDRFGRTGFDEDFGTDRDPPDHHDRYRGPSGHGGHGYDPDWPDPDPPTCPPGPLGGPLSEEPPPGRAEQAVRAAVAAAQDEVARMPAIGRSAPSCTLAAAIITRERDGTGHVTVGWIGDSRVYLFTTRCFQRLTEDDTWAAEAARAGLIPASAVETDRRAHTLTRWLGGDAEDVTPHVRAFPLPASATVLVCTDGLWNYLSRAEDMAAVVGQLPPNASPIMIARHLTGHAIDRGGHDNITVVVTRAGPDPIDGYAGRHPSGREQR